MKSPLNVKFLLLLVIAGLSGTLGAEEAGGDTSAGPRLGTYVIQSYGAVGRPPLVLGSLVLEAGGVYKVLLPGGKPGGEGKYAYDAATKTVTWQGGPYEADKFGGEFTVEREGKTHKIRLKRTTIATNSTDAEK
ncbi:MAG: hypothetical protein HS116_02715 [Planctomycetes bacterium]|nr:hypothetical protein [Planctomycetota bacterium]